MIVNRWVWTVKRGCQNDFVELLKAEAERCARHAVRIYVPSIGPCRALIALEYEYEDLQDYEEFWAEWLADPEAAQFMRKAGELHTEQVHQEIWSLVD